MSQRGNILLKRLDRWVGIPLIGLLRIFKTAKYTPKNPNLIGVMVTAAIGDTILASVLTRGLKSRFPQAKIILIHGSSNGLITPFVDGIDERVSIPATRPWRAVPILKDLQLDLLIDTGQWAKLNALLSFFSQAKFTVGFNTPGQYRHSLYDHSVEHSDLVHETENFRSLGKIFEIPDMPPQLINLPKVENEKGSIIFHIKPSGEKSWLKEWPEENWLALLNHFTAQGHHVILTGSPEDAKSLRPIYEAAFHPDRVTLMAGAPFGETLKVLQKAKLVVSVNTGIMHIASVLGRNLVALHGPTNPRRWGPVNKNSISLESSLPCAPCLNLGFEYGCGQNLCMRSLSLVNTIKASERLLIP